MQEEKLDPADDSAAAEGKSLEGLLAEAQAKIEQQRDAMMRAIAETDNVRKRLQAEAATNQKYALERFGEGLLPVVDSLEAAVAARDVSGVDLTLKQLLGALEKGHIRPVDPRPGERFDPNRHQAMAAVPSEQEPNTVVSVLQKGYHLHDRILRPALVTVAKALEKTGGTPISDADPN